MKLELKHLAGYLPYGLKLWHNQWKEILIMDCCGSNSDFLSIEDVAEYAKPILHPLSDIKEFDKEENIIYKPCYRWILVNDLGEINVNSLNWLLENNFDIYGLIDQGLAIDINTLNI